ncbi:MAG: GTPase Era [Pseudoramibacter sp.]
MSAFKSGLVALIGRPNAGKSTLLNALMGEKLVITSPRPQTTRNAIRCIRTDETSQMVFVDTPGVHRPNNRLDEAMKQAINDTLEDVDVALYLMDAALRKITPEDQYIQKIIGKKKAPVILVLNKIDQIPKARLLEKMDWAKEQGIFADIMPVSAVHRDGVDDLIRRIQDLLPEGPMYFPDDMVIDKSERFIVSEIIREKALRYLRDEVPHGIAVEVTKMHGRKGKHGKTVVDIEADIECEKKSHKGIIIGKGGAMLKKIGSDARQEIEAFLGKRVNLQLWVKVRAKWRDDDRALKDLGYRY